MPPKQQKIKKTSTETAASLAVSTSNISHPTVSSSSTSTTLSKSPWNLAASQFPSASPTKSDGFIAYVHLLSPSKRNKRDTMDYYTLLLQTEQTTEQALLYSKSKRSLLHECETKRTPVKIQKFTYTEDGAKIVINDMTKLTQPLPTEYGLQFQPPSASLYPKCTVQEIQQSSINDWQLISFSGKVLHRGDPTVVGVKKLDLIESTFADTTGTITVSESDTSS